MYTEAGSPRRRLAAHRSSRAPGTTTRTPPAEARRGFPRRASQRPLVLWAQRESLPFAREQFAPRLRPAVPLGGREGHASRAAVIFCLDSKSSRSQRAARD